MATEWQHATIDELPLQIIDGDRGKNYPRVDDFSSTGYCLFLNAGNVTPRGFEFTHKQFISKEKDGALRKGRLRRGDLVLTTRGTVGNAAYFSEEIPYEVIRINSGMVILRPDETQIDAEYLYAVLKSGFFGKQVASYFTGSAQPQLPIRDLKKLKLPLPPLPEQRAIADILGSLDDKIELNRQMNATPEATARALFKSWFVDFDPVHAKAAGEQPYGMDAATADLFPDTFEDSALEPIPSGWRPTTLSDVITIHDAKRIPLSKAQRSEKQGNYPYYGATGIMDSVDEYLFDGIYVLMAEDGSVITDAGTPVLQYVWGKFWVNNHAHVLQGANGVSSEHLLLALQEVQIDPFINGAVQLKINQANMKRIPFLKPSIPVATAFQDLIAPLFARYRFNREEIQVLVSLRDALLPKLVSGQVRVKEAASDWHEFIERTAGILADDPIERPPQPPYEEREPLE